VSLGTDVGRLGLDRSQRSNSSQRCSVGLRSELCAGQSSSSTRSRQTISVWTSLCAWGNRKGPSSNCCHKVGSTESSRMSLYAVALRFPFTGTKGPSSNHEKQPQTIIPPPQNFTDGIMYWGR
jgi:hypothetical protein